MTFICFSINNYHGIMTFVLFFNDFFRDIMTFTLFQKTEEIEFSRGCLHFLSSAHTSMVQYPIVHFLKTIELYILL